MGFDDVEFKNETDKYIHENLADILYSLNAVLESSKEILKGIKKIEKEGDNRFDTAKLFFEYLHADSDTKLDIMENIAEEIYGSLLD